jgi:hypothetical protein
MSKSMRLMLTTALLSGLTAAAVTVQENVNFPDLDLIISQQVDEGSAGIRDLESGANDIEANMGQTFTLDNPATIRAITLKSHSTYAETWLTTGDEVLDIWIGENDGVSTNFVAGSTNLLTSVAISNMAFAAGSYYTFNLDSDVMLPAGDYCFQFQFQRPGTKNQWFVRRADGGGTYAGGGLVFTQTVDGTSIDFPADAEIVDGNDLVFALHSNLVGEVFSYADIYQTAGGEFPLNNLVVSQSTGAEGGFLRHDDIRDSMVGQTFVLDEETVLSQLTLGVNSGKTATNATNNLVQLWIGSWNGSPGEVYLSEMIDLTDFAFANSYYRIDFTDVTVPAGTNVFQLKYVEYDPSHSIALKRTSADAYADGTLYFRQYTIPSSASLPFSAGTDFGDLVFALHSASSATVAGTGTAFPSDNIFAGNTVGSAVQQMRLDSFNQTFGQTFTLASETTLDALTLKSSINTSFDSNPHEVEIWIGTFTNVNTVGTTYLREKADFAGLSLSSGNYYKFDLTDVTLPAGKYALQMYWTESNTAHRINWALGDNDGAYTGGDRQFWSSPDNVLPFTVAEQSGDDMVFALHEAVAIVSDPYDTWTGLYNLTGSNALLTADVEPDGLNNLLEYALGGNPTNNDASSVLPVGMLSEDSGTNWLYYVYTERTGDTGLVYRVGTKTNLVTDTVLNTNDVSFVDESAESAGLKTVTNRTKAAESIKFIGLEVEK